MSVLLLARVDAVVVLAPVRGAVGVTARRGCALLIHRPRGGHGLAGRVLLAPVGWALAVRVVAVALGVVVGVVSPLLVLVVAVLVAVPGAMAVALRAAQPHREDIHRGQAAAQQH